MKRILLAIIALGFGSQIQAMGQQTVGKVTARGRLERLTREVKELNKKLEGDLVTAGNEASTVSRGAIQPYAGRATTMPTARPVSMGGGYFAGSSTTPSSMSGGFAGTRATRGFSTQSMPTYAGKSSERLADLGQEEQPGVMTRASMRKKYITEPLKGQLEDYSKQLDEDLARTRQQRFDVIDAEGSLEKEFYANNPDLAELRRQRLDVFEAERSLEKEFYANNPDLAELRRQRLDVIEAERSLDKELDRERSKSFPNSNEISRLEAQNRELHARWSQLNDEEKAHSAYRAYKAKGDALHKEWSQLHDEEEAYPAYRAYKAKGDALHKEWKRLLDEERRLEKEKMDLGGVGLKFIAREGMTTE